MKPGKARAAAAAAAAERASERENWRAVGLAFPTLRFGRPGGRTRATAARFTVSRAPASFLARPARVANRLWGACRPHSSPERMPSPAIAGRGPNLAPRPDGSREGAKGLKQPVMPRPPAKPESYLVRLRRTAVRSSSSRLRAFARTNSNAGIERRRPAPGPQKRARNVFDVPRSPHPRETRVPGPLLMSTGSPAR